MPQLCITDRLVIMSALVADVDIIFFALWFLLFTSPNLSGRRVDVYHTSIVSDIAIFVLKRDVKLQPTN